MIEKKETAKALAENLARLEKTRQNLESASDEELVDRANEYQEARVAATPVFVAAQQEFDGTAEPEQPATEADSSDQAAAPDAEASPGVPLEPAPGEVVTAAALERFGTMAEYVSKENPDDPGRAVEATTFAFDAGTVIDVGADVGAVGGGEEVATEQPSRIVRRGETLGVVANDVFNQAYEPAPEPAVGSVTETEEPPADAVESNGGAAAPDEQPEGGAAPPVS